MSETVNSEQRITAVELARYIGYSRAYISKLKKEGKLIFEKDTDQKDRIRLCDALEQLKGSVDFNRDPQRKWAETQRQGRALNLPNPVIAAETDTVSTQLKEIEGGRYFKGALRQAILTRDGFRCKLCGKTPQDGILLEVDHITEFEDGGKTTFENGQTVCSDCNKGKHALKKISDSDEYISQKEFARRVGTHRNAISDAIDKGIITKDITTGNINYTTEVIKWFKKKYEPEFGYIDPDNPHGLPEGNTPAFLLSPGDIKCPNSMIGVETQRSKLMRETYEARLAEMEFREKSNELITVQGVIEANRRLAGSIRSKFIGMGTKLALRLEGKTAAEIQFAIEDEINIIFTELFSIGGGKEEE